MSEGKATYEELEARLAELQNNLDEARRLVLTLISGKPEPAAGLETDDPFDANRIFHGVMNYIPEGITVADRQSETILMESRYGSGLSREDEAPKGTPLRYRLEKLKLRRPGDGVTAPVEQLPLWRATMHGETVREEEWVFPGVQGEAITLLISAGPIRDDTGKIVGGVAAWRDSTMRKRLEAELELREEKFRRIFELTPDPVVVSCLRTKAVVDVNQAFLDATGYTRKEAMNLDATNLWASDERRREYRDLIMREGQVQMFEADFVKKNGEIRRGAVSARRLTLGDSLTVLAVVHDITEQKRAEEELRTSEQLLTKVLHTLPVGVFILNAEGRITRINPAAETIWGGARYIGKEEFGEYRGWWARTGEPIGTSDWAAARAVTRGETSINEQILIEGLDGKKKYILNSAVPLKAPDGAITGALVVIEDITARYEAEAALRLSEEKYRDVVETAGVLIVRADLEGRITFLNEYAKTFFGCDDSAIGGFVLDVYKFLDEAGREPAMAQLQEILAVSEGTVPVESKSIGVDGETVWVAWSIRPVLNLEGRVVEFQGVGLDITERKRAEEAISRSESQFRTVIEAVPTIVWTLLPDNTVEYVNQQWVDYLGLPRERAAEWFNSIHPDDQQSVAEAVNKFDGEGPFKIEYRLRRHDGVYRWHLSRAVQLKDDEGKPLRWFGTSTDIHDQKMTEQDLRRLAEELERSNRELEEFAYVASHDLQEPLRMITGYLQLIERRYKGQLDQDADEFIAYAVDGASRMQRLIADLLAYSRVGTRGHPLIPTDLNRAFERAQADLWTTLVETGARITRDPLPTVNGDETQLAQLFLNLMANAIKFRSDKIPEIHIGAQSDNGAWRISVSDNGIGIEPQYQSRVFQVFQRLHTREKYPGTGIGLAICKKIVDRHGGRIWYESEPGEGSTFYFTLPKTGDDDA